jgi:two-component system OmpR family sensor kinase/two-component system sensor histidine kinase BaeS
MNRLWVRLSIIFTLVIVIAVLLLGVTTIIFIRDGIPHPIIVAGLTQPDGLVSRLETYYREDGSWENASNLMREYEMAIPRGVTSPRISLILAEPDGAILYSGFNSDPPEMTALTSEQITEAIPIMVEGASVAYLYINDPPLPVNEPVPAPFPIGSWTNGILTLIAVGGVLGVIAGVLASRQLTAPLSQLARTARSFSSRNMTVRAAIRGTSEVRLVAKAFNDMADELEGAERLRRGMLADVAHELRTPLTVLQANLQAILDDVYPLNKDEIGALAEQVELLRRLVNDLHLLAQAESKQLPLDMQPVELNGLITRSLDNFDAVAQAHRVTLHAELPPATVRVSGDADRLTQVLNNLIQNALTHTPDGGAVTVSLRQTDTRAEISVQDTGGGIPKDAQAHIFDRFYRVEAARDRASGGAGLGLAIVKVIVELHHGTVTVSSDGAAGKGTLFTVSLPM